MSGRKILYKNNINKLMRDEAEKEGEGKEGKRNDG